MDHTDTTKGIADIKLDGGDIAIGLSDIEMDRSDIIIALFDTELNHTNTRILDLKMDTTNFLTSK